MDFNRASDSEQKLNWKGNRGKEMSFCKLIMTLLTYSKSCFQHPGGILTHLVLLTEIIYYNAKYDKVSFI